MSLPALRWGRIWMLVGIAALAACGNEHGQTASEYDIVVSPPRFVVPSDALPQQAPAQASNNNVDIALFEQRLFLAWRTAPSHFASSETRLQIVSSTDGGEHWDFEHAIHLGTDMREPRLLAFEGVLQLFFFEAGDNPAAFEPRRIWRTRRLAAGQWSELELFTDQPEVPWDLKARDGRAWLTSYRGDHYGAGAVSDIRVFFRSSDDGSRFNPVDDAPWVYRGGVSEVAFEFDSSGSLWAVTRNEDGDDSGFGSHLCHAEAGALGQWDCSHSDPERYDSPEMFRHGEDIYLVARRDIGGPYDEGLDDLSFLERKFQYLVDYSFRPKRTALYRIDRHSFRVEHLFDLPGAGDTAFPSVQQTGPHSFVLANYTSPLDQPDIPWIEGQNSDRGTQIYLLDIDFVPRRAGEPTTTPTATPLRPTATATPRGGQSALNVTLRPVFAAPGTALELSWPTGSSVEGSLTFDAGFTVGPGETTAALPDDEGVFEGSGFVRVDGVFATQTGVVVRSNTLAVTPLRRFNLIEPGDATAQGVIRTVIPAFYWAATSDTLALATDATGKGTLDWTKVTTASLERGSDGTFTTGSVDFDVELSGAGARPSGRFVGLRQATFRGVIAAEGIVSPITMDAEIVIADVVDVLEVLGGFPEAQALQFVAGIFGFNPDNPPATAPFRGELALQ